mgnify:CR=1 FL=1|tara:strand:+ start:85 stop:381 length:297 start_codon:yes stop_codon:yes gene_type:complete
MCVPLAGMAVQGGLLEQFGDPLGTKKRRDNAAAEDQRNRWAREDAVRDAQFAHDERLAGIQYGSNTNRASLNAGKTGTPSSTRGGGRSSPGGKTNRAY